MRVLLLNQYFHPDVAATAQLAADLGEALVQRGHQVVAVASRRPYSGEGRLPARAEHGGVEIVRVPATALGRGRHLLRAIDYATFFAGALVPVLATVRPDVVVALSTPPFIAAAGLLAKRLGRAKLVCWVMDVYPEVAIRLGALAAGGAAARLLSAASRAVYRGADAIVALDDAMRERLIEGGAGAEKVEVIDNWCDGEAIRPVAPADNPLRRELGIADVFTVSYSGNMGNGHDLETLAAAMVALRGEAIHWLIIGDGPRREVLERAVREVGPRRATLLSYRRRDELPVSLTAADASVVSLDQGLAGLIVPSKLYGILAAGIPLVYVGPDEGRAAEVTRGQGVGLSVRNRDVAGLTKAVISLKVDGDMRRTMGRRARQLFERQFDKRVALERHHRLLLRVVGPC